MTLCVPCLQILVCTYTHVATCAIRMYNELRVKSLILFSYL